MLNRIELLDERVPDTFPIVKRKDVEKHNDDYRTNRVILEIYDAVQHSMTTGTPCQNRLDPPAAAVRCFHPPER